MRQRDLIEEDILDPGHEWNFRSYPECYTAVNTYVQAEILLDIRDQNGEILTTLRGIQELAVQALQRQ